MNSSASYINLTQPFISGSRTAEVMKIIFEVLTMICFCVFLYYISLILHVFFTAPHVRDIGRYVLFAHMLINDTLYLTAAIILVMCSALWVYIPVPICYAIISLATATFRITPYNLAAMALERYAAICFPLRHVTLCTSQRSKCVIAAIWVMGLSPNIADVIILSSLGEKTFFSSNVKCSQDSLTLTLQQDAVRSVSTIISLILVGLILVFTYVRVMYVAKSLSSSSSSASKAVRTVILHAFQFLLCIMSLTSSFTETRFRDYISFLPIANFFFFTCLPRCLSPLVYGIRDGVLSKYIRQMHLAKPDGLNVQ
ncbi:odorant receptor 131-2-like [Pseudophryne corroboree]|uniref:odorant receptor 131-2-like n=1 Tax=Pseudophryne corroboree TaxID=495146 RepID=UPI0030812B6F